MLKNLASQVYNNIQSFIDISVLKCDPLDNCRQWGMCSVKYMEWPTVYNCCLVCHVTYIVSWFRALPRTPTCIKYIILTVSTSSL